MIERIDGLPGNVLGITATGKVTAADYESVVMPAVVEMLKQHDTLHLLYHLAQDFTGFAPGALLDDAKMSLEHYRAWDRVAIVTDLEWARDIAIALDLLFPAYVRVFQNSELEDAKAWVSEQNGPGARAL